MRTLSLAIQNECIEDPECAKTLSTLFADFGTRVYSALRAPMEMEAFSIEGFDRHFSGTRGEGVYKGPAHQGLSLTKGLKLAMALFKKSLQQAPDNWK